MELEAMKLNLSKLRKILAQEGLVRQAGSPVPPDEREAALEALAASLRVNGARKAQGTVEERRGHAQLEVEFHKGDFKVGVELAFYQGWKQPVVRIKGFAPNAGGRLEEVYAAGNTSGIKPTGRDASQAINKTFETLELSHQPMDPAPLMAAARKVKALPGFKKSIGWGNMMDFAQGAGEAQDKKNYYVMLESDNIRIIVNFGFVSWGSDKGSVEVSGHVNFKSPKGWLTLSRRGISDSFEGVKPGKINQEVREQIKRATPRLEDYQGAVSIQIGHSSFTMTPKRIQGIKDKLSKGQKADITPGGMGTGYYLSTRRPPGRYGIGDVSADVAAIFGVRRLYYETFDYD